MQKILIIGAGAIGVYLGANLSQKDHAITFQVKNQRLKSYRQKGIVLDQIVAGANAAKYAHIEPTVRFVDETFRDTYHTVIVCTKSYDTESAVDALKVSGNSFDYLLTTQNGIGVDDIAIERFGAKVVSGSVTAPVSHKIDNRYVVEKMGRGIALAPTVGNKPAVSQIADLFAKTPIKTTIVNEGYQSLKWSKALLNMVGNASSAILGVPPARVYANRETFGLEFAMLKEALSVMEAQGIELVDLPGASAKSLANAVRTVPRWLLKPILTRQVAKGRGNKLPSFYLDLKAGKPKNEVIYHNGAISALGKELGIATPANDKLAGVLNDLVLQHVDKEDWRDQYRQLAA